MHDVSPVGSEVQAGRREWLGMAVLALPTLLVSLDIGALFLALPHLSADLGASSTQQLWIADIYGFLTAGFLITMGNLGDRIGRRRLLLIGAAAFGVASILAAYSSSAEMLILTRAALGIAGATLMPSTLALISNMFVNPRERGKAIALWVTCLMAGAALGPVIGGTLLAFFWWGSVFLIGVPVMALLLVTGPRLLPEYKAPQAGPLDLISVGLSLAALLPMIYGIKELAATSHSRTVPIIAVIVGAAVGVLFVRRQRRLESPLLDLRLFSNRSFSLALTIMVLGTATMGGVFLLISQYVQSVQDLPAELAGLALAPSAISIAIGAMITPKLAQRIKPSYLIGGGLSLAAFGFLLVALAGTSGGGLALVIIGLICQSLGAGPMFALGTGIVLGMAPPERAGSAASLQETANQFGGAIGLAMMGTLGTAIYRSQIADAMPAGIPPDQAAMANENLANAIDVAAELPGVLAAQLLDAAREAFTNGLNVAGIVGTVIVAALAAASFVQFRGLQPFAQMTPPDAPPEATVEADEAEAEPRSSPAPA